MSKEMFKVRGGFNLLTFTDLTLEVCKNPASSEEFFFRVKKARFENESIPVWKIKNIRVRTYDFFSQNVPDVDLGIFFKSSNNVEKEVILAESILDMFAYSKFPDSVLKNNLIGEDFCLSDCDLMTPILKYCIEALDNSGNWRVTKEFMFLSDGHNVLMVVNNILLNQSLYTFFKSEDVEAMSNNLENNMAIDRGVKEKLKSLMSIKMLNDLNHQFKDGQKPRLKI